MDFFLLNLKFPFNPPKYIFIITNKCILNESVKKQNDIECQLNYIIIINKYRCKCNLGPQDWEIVFYFLARYNFVNSQFHQKVSKCF